MSLRQAHSILFLFSILIRFDKKCISTYGLNTFLQISSLESCISFAYQLNWYSSLEMIFLKTISKHDIIDQICIIICPVFSFLTDKNYVIHEIYIFFKDIKLIWNSWSQIFDHVFSILNNGFCMNFGNTLEAICPCDVTDCIELAEGSMKYLSNIHSDWIILNL